MHMGNSDRLKISKTATQYWAYKTFWGKGEKRGNRVLNFRQWVIYRYLRKSGTYIAGKFLLDNSETMGHVSVSSQKAHA